MGRLGEDRYDAALQAETARFAEAVHDADPARPVPTCPEWTLAQLTEHVGQAQRWVTVVLERRAPVPNAQVRVRVPQDPDGRSAWLVAGARRLGQAVREVVIDPDLAADGISDLLDMFAVLPRVDNFPELAELAGAGQTLQFQATDAGLGPAAGWLVRRDPSGLASADGLDLVAGPLQVGHDLARVDGVAGLQGQADLDLVQVQVHPGAVVLDREHVEAEPGHLG